MITSFEDFIASNSINNEKYDDIDANHTHEHESDYEEDFENESPRSYRLSVNSNLQIDQNHELSEKTSSNDQKPSGNYHMNYDNVTESDDLVLNDELSDFSKDFDKNRLNETKINNNDQIDIKNIVESHMKELNTERQTEMLQELRNIIFDEFKNIKKSQKIHENEAKNTKSERKPKIIQLKNILGSNSSHFSNIKELDQQSVRRIQGWSKPTQSQSNISNKSSLSSKHGNDVSHLLKILINNAANQIKNDQENQKLLGNVSIPVKSMTGGLNDKDIKEIDDVIDNEEKLIDFASNHPEQYDIIHSLISQRFVHNSAPTNVKVMTTTDIPPRDDSAKTMIGNKYGLPVDSRSSGIDKHSERVIDVDNHEDEVVRDKDLEYAKICVNRPDISSKCESHYQSFLSSIIGTVCINHKRFYLIIVTSLTVS